MKNHPLPDFDGFLSGKPLDETCFHEYKQPIIRAVCALLSNGFGDAIEVKTAAQFKGASEILKAAQEAAKNAGLSAGIRGETTRGGKNSTTLSIPHGRLTVFFVGTPQPESNAHELPDFFRQRSANDAAIKLF